MHKDFSACRGMELKICDFYALLPLYGERAFCMKIEKAGETVCQVLRF